MALAPARLTRSEHFLLSDPDVVVFASAISLWELRIKWEKKFVSGERKGPADPIDVLNGLRARRVIIEPLLGDQAVSVLRDVIRTRDPFDEQLLIHAQVLGLSLLTRDKKLYGHPLVISASDS